MAELSWYYGPTDSDPDPGAMWHYGCGGRVEWIKSGPSAEIDGVLVDDGAMVCDCGAQDDAPLPA